MWDVQIRSLFWLPVYFSRDRLYYMGGAVAALLLWCRTRVDLHQLRVVAAVVQFCANGVVVRRETIGGQLEALIGLRGGCDLLGESTGRPGIAPAELEGQDQFGAPLDGDESPGVSDKPLLRLLQSNVLLLAAHKAPDLIALHILDRHVADLRRQQPFATFSGSHQELHDRVAVQSGDALNTADTVALNQQLKASRAWLSITACLCPNRLLNSLWSLYVLPHFPQRYRWKPLRRFPALEQSIKQLWHVILALLSSGASAKMTVGVTTLPLAKARGQTPRAVDAVSGVGFILEVGAGFEPASGGGNTIPPSVNRGR